MEPEHAISGSKSKSKSIKATGSGALVSCTNRGSKPKNKVKAVVVETREKIKEMVATLMKNDASGYRESVIGFELGYGKHGNDTKIHHFILCNGSIAYVFFVSIDPRLPQPLMSFLNRPEFSFVSMGMQLHLNKLAKQYEAGCRNTVDLGELASQLKGKPQLQSCGIDLLAKGIGLSETPRRSSVVGDKSFERAYDMVDEDDMFEAIVKTWAYQMIGKTLLYG